MRVQVEEWYRKYINKTIIQILVGISLLILTVQLVVFLRFTYFSIASIILLVVLLKYYNEAYSPLIFIGALICLSLSSYLTLLIPLSICIYAIYIILDTHRVKRIKKLASSTPDEIAKISKTGNKVEIIIEGVGGGGKK